MKITICIGSSCHLKGSRQIVESLQELVDQNGLAERMQLSGTFCMGRCTEGVCVRVDDAFFSLKPEDTASFFSEEVLPRLRF